MVNVGRPYYYDNAPCSDFINVEMLVLLQATSPWRWYHFFYEQSGIPEIALVLPISQIANETGVISTSNSNTVFIVHINNQKSHPPKANGPQYAIL